jgi:hypothetical protein
LILGRQKHRSNRRRADHKKHSIAKTDEEEDDAADNDINNKRNEGENEIRRIELAHPVRVREGHGFSIRQRHKIDPNHIRPNNRQQRQCWSWYRRITQKLRRNPEKYLKACIHPKYRHELCINQLIYNTFNNTEEKQQHPKIFFPIGSKLYCENDIHSKKFLGLYDHDEICFYPNNQVYIEQEFTDIASLSDMQKNQDTLDFIANHQKLNAEFKDDCHEKTNLVETND